MLEQEHRLGVEEVDLALAAPLVVAAGRQRLGRLDLALVGGAVASATSLARVWRPTPPIERVGAGEVAVDEVGVEADGLEDLRAGVGGDGGDADLGHHLEHARAQGPM